ncbi:MAG: DUF3024 domain-containing protein [Acidimicrobiia bacterium]|nr:MAG: DUF3024 domain-containing protein [Acidimicrobiia bacterium]
MIPEVDLARVQRWMKARNDAVPERVRDQIRFEMDVGARAITIYECHPPWREDMGPDWTRLPSARLRYTKTRSEWSLYWRDRNSMFHEYDFVPATPYVSHLLAEIDRDPTHIFWG